MSERADVLAQCTRVITMGEGRIVQTREISR
jgi:hypothetical protein